MVVYFVQAATGGPIKIGVALNLANRLKGLQHQCPVPLICLASMPGYTTEESALHDCFADTRLHGEWFEPSSELLEFIASVAGGESLPTIDHERSKEPAGRTVDWRRYLRVRERIRQEELIGLRRLQTLRLEVEQFTTKLKVLHADMNRMQREHQAALVAHERAGSNCDYCLTPIFPEDDGCTYCDYCAMCGVRLPNRRRSMCDNCRSDNGGAEAYTIVLSRRIGYVASLFENRRLTVLAERAASVMRKRATRKRTVEALRLMAECLDLMSVEELRRDDALSPPI